MVRYSPEGTKISVVLDIGEQAFSLAVADEGIGIPEAERERIFEPFVRGSNAGQIGGTGLGAQPREALRRADGGPDRVASRRARRRVSRHRSIASTHGLEMNTAPSSNILVIEDDGAIRATLIDILELNGHSVIHAANGPDGLALVTCSKLAQPNSRRGSNAVASA